MENTPSLHRNNSLFASDPAGRSAASPFQIVLSEPQMQALEWLTNGGSITDAAQFAGVSRQTVSIWLNHDPDFRTVYEGWRKQIMTLTDGQLAALAESAVSTIADAVRNRRNIQAAKFVIKQLTATKK